MPRAIRVLNHVLVGLAVALALVITLFIIITSTPWGLERVRRTIVGTLEERIEGELRIERITAGRLLAGATFHGIEIDDPRGRPFLRIDSISARYHWRTLLAGDVVFDRATAYRPRLVLEKLPVDTLWNFEIIFPERVPDPERSLILFDRTRIVDGRLTVRTPWEPEAPVAPRDTARMILVEAPGGLVREYRFESIQAALPRVMWESPDEIGQAFEVASLATHGFVWEDPFDLRDLRGTVTIRDSIISFDAPYFELPDSRASALGRVITAQERAKYDIRIQSPRAMFRDLQWLYPPLPDEGGGRFGFTIQSQEPAGTLWYASDARITAPGTELAGDFGIVTGDTLYFTQVSLRASPLNLELLEGLLPIDLPVDGLLVGTVVVEGPLSSVRTDADLRLARRGRDDSAVRWAGTLDLRPPYGIGNVRADLRNFDLSLLAPVTPGLDLAGAVSGRIGASGRLDRELRFSGSLSHVIGDRASRFDAEGSISRLRHDPVLEARIDGHPFDLEAIGSMVPGLERLRGTMVGPLTLRGTAAEMEIGADVATAFGGIRLEGVLDRTAALPRYRATGRATAFRLNEAIAGLPRVEVSGDFRLDGTGDGFANLTGSLEAEVDATDIGGFAFPDARLRLSAAGGMARLDLLEAYGPAGRLRAHGGFGLAEGHSGTLEVEIDADSLNALRAFLPDTVLRLNGEADGAELAGRATARFRLDGWVNDFTVTGEAESWDLEVGHTGAAHMRAEIAGRRDHTGLAGSLDVRAGELNVWGRPITAARLSGDYNGSGGGVRLDVRAPTEHAYAAAGSFSLAEGSAILELAELDLLTGQSPWRLEAPARGRVGRDGLQLEELKLVRADGSGRLRAAGRLPWAADTELEMVPADFVVELQDLPLVDFLRIAQPDPLLGGTITRGRIRVTGAARAPAARAELDIADFQVGDARIDRLETVLTYADRLLAAEMEAVHDGRPMLTGTGRLPLDLALAPIESRWTQRPLHFSVRVDAMPAALPAAMLGALREVEGRLDGTIEVGGTLESPTLDGVLTLRGGAATLTGLGVRYRGIEGTFRLADDALVEVDAGLRTAPGSATVSGTVGFQPLTDPTFDLVLRARELEAARRRDVELVATGELRLTGRYTRPVVTGSLRTDSGVLNLDELARQQHMVELGAPFLFQVVDTTLVSVREFLPASENPFLRNVLVDANLRAPRDLWLRGRDLNAEVGGDLTVRFDRQTEDLRLFGELNVLRGNYLLYGRRFEVRRGAIEFAGGAGMNPVLDILAGYRARTVRGDPLEIRAVVTGTLSHPRVELTSDIQPPLSQSDLASYLIFGRPTDELAAGENRALGAVRLGVGAVGPTFFGYAASGIETIAAENLGIDYLAITTHGADPGFDGTRFDGFFAGSQVEVGRYISENLFLAFTERLGMGSRDVRLEWRFRPTWTGEVFGEDRFARQPTFGRSQPFEFRTVYGFFLYREWGY